MTPLGLLPRRNVDKTELLEVSTTDTVLESKLATSSICRTRHIMLSTLGAQDNREPVLSLGILQSTNLGQTPGTGL